MTAKYMRRFLKKKESKNLKKDIQKRVRVDLTRILGEKDNIEIVEKTKTKIIIINRKAILIISKEKIFPSLNNDDILKLFPRVVIDMGAIPYICKGANIMAPGIVRYEGEFQKNEIVTITEERYNRVIAVGETMYDYNTMKEMAKGEVISNNHFVGDKIWKFINETLE